MIVGSDLTINVSTVEYSTTRPKIVGNQEKEATKAIEVQLKAGKLKKGALNKRSKPRRPKW